MVKNKKQNIFQTAKGFHDILPPTSHKFLDFFNIVKEIVQNFGFNYIETPIVERKDIFERPIGLQTDIVEKEMFYLAGKEYVLRPEGTAAVVRAYIENGLFTLPQPQKFFYYGPMFRKENPQRGRYRQHHQLGIEILGNAEPIYDAFVFNIFNEIFKKLKINNIVFYINSIGCVECRPKIKEKIKIFYRPYLSKVCQDCHRRYKFNPLRLLDCKQDKEISSLAPEIVDFLCSRCREHFEKLLELLDGLEINYEIKNNIVRGLDYYNRTVFEIFYQEKEDLALGGGGRYDELASFFVKRKVPGVGGALGVDRVIEIWENYKSQGKREIGIIIIGKEVTGYVMKIINLLTKEDFRIIESLGKENIKQQLEFMTSLNIRYLLFIGEVEMKKERVVFKDLKTGIQEEIYVGQLIKELKNKVK